MIIAIAASENHLKSKIDPHFGRCDWYCIYDTESHKDSFIENTFRYQLEKAGTDAAELLIRQGVIMVIAGRFGSKVINIFKASKVQMVIPETQQTIKKIIDSLK
jgi:predicted Fe-Mo cluster-binding NifX family protein